jgi:hypothetical protein
LMIPMLLPRKPRPTTTRITPNNTVGSRQPAYVGAGPADCGGESDVAGAGAGAGVLPGGDVAGRGPLPT